MRLVSTFSWSRISRQASAIDSATPLGLQAPGLMITSASRKRLPWGRSVSDMSDVSVKEREMLLTAAARRTSAHRAGLNSAGVFTDTKSPESCCTSDLLYLRVYGNSYPTFQVFVRTNVCSTI